MLDVYKRQDTDAATKDSGIKMAMAMKSGWAHTGDNPYNILRVWVGNAVDIKHFEERISTCLLYTSRCV